MARVLVVEDSPTQAQQIELLLRDGGYEVERARNGVEALNAMARQTPDVVLTDLEMPEMNGLALVEHVRASYPAVPVILMTAYGSEDIAAYALQQGAAGYVPKRYLTLDILPTLENVLAVTQAQEDDQRARDLLADAEFHYVMPNDLTLIPPLIGQIEEQLARFRLCDETGIIQVCVALREALINAVHHGNLELKGDPYEQYEKGYEEPVGAAAAPDDSTFYLSVIVRQDAIEKRSRQAPYLDRRVHVSVKLSPRQAEFVVRDEGNGFDTATIPDPANTANLENLRGRGLLLIRTFMDEVRHNDKGNEITLIKRRRE